MRGSTPLDVAAASVMDNNELALALREPDLEKVKLSNMSHSQQLKQKISGCLIETDSTDGVFEGF